MSQTLYACFQKTSSSKSCPPNQQEPLSKQLPSCIESANNLVQQVVEEMAEGTKGRKRGPYEKYTSKDRAEVANYATLHESSAAIRHFKARFPDDSHHRLEGGDDKGKNAERDGQLEKIVAFKKKRGRLPDSVRADIKCYICSLRDAGCVVNTAIVLASCNRH